MLRICDQGRGSAADRKSLGKEKNCRGRRSKGGFRFEIGFAFEERRGRVKRIFIGGKRLRVPLLSLGKK